jgi:diaminobutyrate-2-oxoglutarate transaminase
MDSVDSLSELHLSETPSVEAVPGPKSKRLIERQGRTESSAVLYPNRIPIALEEAKGATIRDVDGNVFLDFFAGVGVANVGHSNPRVVAATNEQTETLVHTLDFPSEPRAEFTEKLRSIAPGGLANASRVMFGGPTGSNAVEATIKLTKHVTGNRGLLAFTGGYHGSTSGALSLSAKRSAKREYTPLLPDVRHLPHPFTLAEDRPEADAVADALTIAREAVEDPYGGLADPAGIWVEPIQGEGGVNPAPDGFLAGLSEIASENGIPLVVDEIQSGFGRTGEWFANEWYDVTPDVMPIAKAAGGGGPPLAGTIYDEALDTVDPGAHTGTFRGYLPAMRAGLAAIEFIEDHDLLAHVREVGESIRARLVELSESHPEIRDVRGKGLFIGVEFADTDDRSAGEIVDAIQTAAYERGVIVWTAGRRGDVLRLLPPLVITETQASVGLEHIADAVDDVLD